jgi:hypothetical protein
MRNQYKCRSLITYHDARNNNYTLRVVAAGRSRLLTRLRTAFRVRAAIRWLRQHKNVVTSVTHSWDTPVLHTKQTRKPNN